MRPLALPFLLLCSGVACATGGGTPRSGHDAAGRLDSGSSDAEAEHDAGGAALDGGVSSDAPFALDAPIGLDAGPPDAGTDASGCGPGLSRCGAACVDLSRDLAHCGACGRACSLLGASETCSGGTCLVASCEPGRGDCDSMAANGCEASCTTGAACTTACGSMGMRACTSVCAPTCSTPAESCNSVDDDCDGECDEGAGCRAGVHRAYDDALGAHFYTTDLAEASSGGHRLEYADFFRLSRANGAGLEPFYRCLLGDGRRFYTGSSVCEGAAGSVNEGVLGYLRPSPGCGTTPLFRLAERGHFYTTSVAERDYAISIGFVDEGTVGHVWTSP